MLPNLVGCLLGYMTRDLGYWSRTDALSQCRFHVSCASSHRTLTRYQLGHNPLVDKLTKHAFQGSSYGYGEVHWCYRTNHQFRMNDLPNTSLQVLGSITGYRKVSQMLRLGNQS